MDSNDMLLRLTAPQVRHKIGGMSKPTLASPIAVQFERSTPSLCQQFQNQGRSGLGSMEDTLCRFHEVGRPGIADTHERLWIEVG